MKPTVINNTSENPHQPQHDQQHNVNDANNGQAPNDHSRRFPQFRQHGFGGFDDPDGDVFADMGLRTRLNRMGNPFDWSARKRRGSGQNAADAYDHHYFDDVDFPFGSTWDAFGRMGNKRHPAETADRSGFFDYVPQEFRQYVPEHFGSHFRGHDGRQPHGHPHQQQQQPQPPPQPQQQQQHHQQQQQAPPQQQQTYQQTGSKSNLCDAAIQTDDLGTQNNGDQKDGPNSADHDNRNGVNQSSSSASSSSNSTPYGNQVHMSTSADGPGAYASASAGNNQNQYYQQSPNYAHQAPPSYGRQYQQPYASQYSQSPKQNQYYGQSTPAPPPQPSPQQQPHQSQEGFVRNVPIVLEETGTPVNKVRTETSAPPPTPPTSQTGPTKARPEPLNKESFASNEPIPMPCPPQPGTQNQQQPQQHSENQDDADSAPPQTPHTADCISKIQAIQRDVLELMLAVEQFGGKRGDKDYAYLDEMLTRNLLKLDTIDTNGKESIRLARKEAIKCIQTSIAVLEAKSDLHLNEKRDSVDQSNNETNADTDATASVQPSNEKPSEKMDVEETAVEQSVATEQKDDLNAEIPKVENISIDDKPINGNDNKSQQSETEMKPEENKGTPEIADAKE